MGFPIAYAGVLPKLLFTAALSMAAIRNLCICLLQFLGILTTCPSPTHHNYNANISASTSLDHPSHRYLNPHLHAPADQPLLLRHTAFFEAVQASLPVILYECLPLDRPAHECSHTDALQSPSQPSLSAEIPAVVPPAFKLLELGDSMLVDTTLSSPSPASLSSSFPLSSSSSTTSHVSAHMPQIDQLQKRTRPLPHCTMPCELQQQALVQRSAAISACGQGEAEDSGACSHHLQQRAECAVCLCAFEKGEEVRELPSCRHVFHKDCIDGWLLHNRRTCPLCRSSLITPAVEMQEKMHEQELFDQLISWFNSLQQGGAAHEDQYVQHEHPGHHPDFYYTLHPSNI